MTVQKKRVWSTSPSGLLVVGGHVTESGARSTTTLLALKGLTNRVEEIFAANGIGLSAPLRQILESTRAASDAWLSNRKASPAVALRATYFQRISRVMLALEKVQHREKFLRLLADGNLDLNSRRKSPAKNVLWELE